MFLENVVGCHAEPLEVIQHKVDDGVLKTDYFSEWPLLKIESTNDSFIERSSKIIHGYDESSSLGRSASKVGGVTINRSCFGEYQ